MAERNPQRVRLLSQSTKCALERPRDFFYGRSVSRVLFQFFNVGARPIATNSALSSGNSFGHHIFLLVTALIAQFRERDSSS